jgi:hypothetical protein
MVTEPRFWLGMAVLVMLALLPELIVKGCVACCASNFGALTRGCHHARVHAVWMPRKWHIALEQHVNSDTAMTTA